VESRQIRPGVTIPEDSVQNFECLAKKFVHFEQSSELLTRFDVVQIAFERRTESRECLCWRVLLVQMKLSLTHQKTSLSLI
jgi:hypothetical protein